VITTRYFKSCRSVPQYMVTSSSNGGGARLVYFNQPSQRVRTAAPLLTASSVVVTQLALKETKMMLPSWTTADCSGADFLLLAGTFSRVTALGFSMTGRFGPPMAQEVRLRMEVGYPSPVPSTRIPKQFTIQSQRIPRGSCSPLPMYPQPDPTRG
jgi:hypothetical protein